MTCDACATLDLNECGNPFPYVFRWADESTVYKSVTAATQAAPCILTVPAHGLPDGWPFLLIQMAGMSQIERSDPTNPYQAVVLSASSLELDGVNASKLGSYTSGGLVQYQPPFDLSTVTAATLNIKAASDSLVALVVSTLNDGITLDNALGTITLEPTLAQIGSLPAGNYYYELKLFTTDAQNPALWVAGYLVWPVVI